MAYELITYTGKPGNGILDRNRDKIFQLLHHGANRAYIAFLFDVTPQAVTMWIKRNTYQKGKDRKEKTIVSRK